MSSGELFFESPPFLRVTWIIPDFFRLAEQSKDYLQSPEFTFADSRYCLRLFNYSVLGHVYFGINLLNLIDTDPERDVWYEVQLKSRTGEIDIQRNKEVFLFERVFWLLMNDLNEHYFPDGTLTVLCSLRPTKRSSAGAKTQVLPKYRTSGELSFESFPSLYVTWRIPGFFQLAPESIYTLDSPEFPFSDHRYCLQLFSNEDLKSVDIKLVNSTEAVPGTHVSYEVGLKSTSGEEILINRSVTSTTREFCICRHNLDYKSSEHFSDGHLTVFCCIRSREPISSGSSMSDVVFPHLKVLIPLAAIRTKSVAVQTSSDETSAKSVAVQTSNEKDAKEVLPGIAKLQSNYRQLLQKGPKSDVCLVVCGKEFRAHQIILRARSTIFDAMFSHETAEKESGRVVIDDLDSESFGDFLEYLYTGGIGAGFSDDNAFGLHKAADKYDVPTLKSECVAYMRRNLSVDSFCDVLTVALRHPEEELLPLAVLFFKENMVRIIVTTKWQQFVIDNGTSANELFIKAFVLPGQ